MAKAVNLVRTVLSLSPNDIRSLLWARRQLMAIDKSLKEDGLNKTKQRLMTMSDSAISRFDSNDTKHIVRTIRRAARVSIGDQDSCLRRSLLLWWILKQLGVETTVRVGVSSQDGALSGHAWVELGDKPLNDRSSVRNTYKVIDLESL